MHIVTGMLIAAVLRNRKKQPRVPLPRTGPVRAEHWMPGRIRFLVPSLQGDDLRAAFLRQKLPTLEGVQSVETNPTTGSLLIRYREEHVRPELLFAAVVRLLGLENELARTPRPVIVKELRSILDSLNRVVYERTGGILDFTSSLLILLAAVGTRKMLAEGAKAMPAGFTLLWWGAHHLFAGGQEAGGEE